MASTTEPGSEGTAAAAIEASSSTTLTDDAMDSVRKRLVSLDTTILTLWARDPEHHGRGKIRRPNSHLTLKALVLTVGGLFSFWTGLIVPATIIAAGAWSFRRWRRHHACSTGIEHWDSDMTEPASYDWSADLKAGGIPAWHKFPSRYAVIKVTDHPEHLTIVLESDTRQVITEVTPTSITVTEDRQEVCTKSLPQCLFRESSSTKVWIAIVDGHIYVGSGCIVPQQIFLRQKLEKPLDPVKIGINTKEKTKLDVAFPKLSPDVFKNELAEEDMAAAGAELLHHMMQGRGPLQRLKKDLYVEHLVFEERFEGEFYMVMITNDHICLLRRPQLRKPNLKKHFLSIGLRDVLKAKVEGVKGFRLTGQVNCHAIAFVKQFEVDDKWWLISVRGVDNNTIDFPVPRTSRGQHLIEALVWTLDATLSEDDKRRQTTASSASL